MGLKWSWSWGLLEEYAELAGICGDCSWTGECFAAEGGVEDDFAEISGHEPAQPA